MILQKLSIGEKIRYYRDERGFNQRELAEKAKVSIATISKAENNVFVPSPEKLSRIADELAIPFSELVNQAEVVDVDTCLDIVNVYLLRGAYQDAMQTIDDTLLRDGVLTYQRNQLLIKKAECLMNTGMVQEALDLLNELRTMIDNNGDADERFLAYLLKLIGNAHYLSSNMIDAYSSYFRAYQITLRFPEFDVLCAQVSYNLGIVCRLLKLDQEARTYIENAQSVFEKIGDNRSLAYAMFELGNVYRNLKNLELAGEYFCKSRALYESENIRHQAKLVKMQHAFYIIASKDTKLAIQELLEAANEFAQESDFPNLSYSYARIAYLLLEKDGGSEAQEYLEKAIGCIDRQSDHEPQYAYVYRVYSEFLRGIKKYELSVNYAFKSADVFGKIGLEKEKALSLEQAIETYRTQGRLEEALVLALQITKMLHRNSEYSVL